MNTDIFDLSINNDQRIKLLYEMDDSNQFEIIKRLMDIYNLSNVKKLEKFFIHLLIYSNKINLYLRCEMLTMLIDKIKNKNTIKKILSNTIFIMVKNAFISNENWLMVENVLQLATAYCDINGTLQTIIILGYLKFKEPFKKIFSLILKFKDLYFFTDLCTLIFEKYNHTVKQNLLLLQIIFEKENKFMDDLFHIANNSELDTNLRLEALDILYLKGSENVKMKVENHLNNVLPNTTYINNPEGVHTTSIQTSIEKTIETLYVLNNDKQAPSDLHSILLDKFKHNHNELNRIFNYNFLKFTKFNVTLKDVIENIYLVVEDQPLEIKNNLYTRLEQELVEMRHTCSQGYISRLINVFSGFEINGAGITLSYEDEIYGIFSHKINKKIEIAPESIRDILLEEIMVPTDDCENRLNLIRYLRPFIPEIWNEIFEIYKDKLTITDLDLYCRKVVMKYEGL